MLQKITVLCQRQRNLKSRTKKERLVIAGALIAAELDRLHELEK